MRPHDLEDIDDQVWFLAVFLFTLAITTEGFLYTFVISAVAFVMLMVRIWLRARREVRR